MSNWLTSAWGATWAQVTQTVTNVWPRITSVTGPRAALIVLLLVVLLGALYLYAPFAPFATGGNIFVSSPEVYTRERLVNDRYEEDFWYRTNLHALDNADNIISGKVSQRLTGDVGVGTGAADAVSSEPHADASLPADTRPDPALPFAIAFRVKSAIRDSIRQLILENTLDDRHDLTGNSIYGLKFDTTIVPGDNTHARASVAISVSIPHPFPSATPTKPGGLSDLVTKYFSPESTSIYVNPNDDIRASYQLYRDWIDSVTERLNTFALRSYTEKAAREALQGSAPPAVLTSLPNQPATSPCGFARNVTLAALESVLGVKINESAIPSDGSPIQLQEPWKNFVVISQVVDSSCINPVSFAAKEQIDSVAITRKDSGLPLLQGYGNLGLEDKDWQIGGQLAGSGAVGTTPGTWVSAGLVDLAMEHHRGIPLSCSAPDQCDQYLIPIPSGFFSFVAQAGKSDAYVYALFPKSEAEAYLSDVATSLSASGVASATGNPLSGLLDFSQASRGFTTRDVLVGYGDGQGGTQSGDDRVRFGWVTGQVRQSMQSSELVLLSVPAWSDELTLSVSVGWLDRNGTHASNQQSFDMKVKLPPDYEAFDTFIAGQQARLLPRISEDFMDNAPVQACKSADIIIPGYRLWRSTVVTLGAQVAERIMVLPNMQGVIAHFDKIAYPTSATSSGGASAVSLRVWTSEGEASSARPITVETSPDLRAARGCPAEKLTGDAN